MEIVVCVKQVPDVDDIKWTKENNLDRSQMLSKINPHDEWALDWALNIKSKFKDVNVNVISMGPSQAKDTLNYCLAKGATRAILLSDKAFGGSDTIVTSKILARAIKKYIPDFDYVITGLFAQDGDTAQVPVSLAQLLDVIDVIGVNEIHNADKNCAIVSQKLADVINIFEISTPCLLAVREKCNNSYIARIEDYVRAQNTPIEEYNITDLGFEKNEVGVLGSPTTVYKAFRPQINKNTQEIKDDLARVVLDFIVKAK